MNLTLRMLFAAALFCAPLLSQSGTVLIGDGATKEVVGTHTSKKSVSVTVSANEQNPDTTIVVKRKNAAGEVVEEWELSGDGDGTGVFELPAGDTVEVSDNTDTDNDGARVSVSVA